MRRARRRASRRRATRTGGERSARRRESRPRDLPASDRRAPRRPIRPGPARRAAAPGPGSAIRPRPARRAARPGGRAARAVAGWSLSAPTQETRGRHVERCAPRDHATRHCTSAHPAAARASGERRRRGCLPQCAGRTRAQERQRLADLPEDPRRVEAGERAKVAHRSVVDEPVAGDSNDPQGDVAIGGVGEPRLLEDLEDRRPEATDRVLSSSVTTSRLPRAWSKTSWRSSGLRKRALMTPADQPSSARASATSTPRATIGPKPTRRISRPSRRTSPARPAGSPVPAPARRSRRPAGS